MSSGNRGARFHGSLRQRTRHDPVDGVSPPCEPSTARCRPGAERLGRLSGQSAVLDTPLLIELLSGHPVREPLEQMIDAARDAGVKVLVLEHYLAELAGLLDARRREAQELEDIIGDPEQRSAFMALTGEDSLLVAYAQLRAEG